MHNSFNDVIDHPWARDDLDTLYAKGYMMNKEPNLFVPNEPITRGEFVTMLVKMFEIPLDYEGSLTFTTCAPTTRSARGCSTTNTSRRRPGRASCAGPSAAALSRTSPWRAKTRR
ncbi:S-layer homology domain-containing protein [Calditerricola satsumensis]|uniref:S-layer homology domain-containing protein n=1 Tax=Calditerricola satsumensis TaxID=373054 RepID=UPI00210A2FBC|nr:S-layer homology domain-containing protein [Calditerricola satsumensis]